MNEIAIFGGGCFWCTEAVFNELNGVKAVMPGYAGGTVPNPKYEQVCSGTTGHAEVIKIEFDPAQISFHDLLTVFFATHDPTTPNRQGGDIGTQYRSIILYTNEKQKQSAEDYVKELNDDPSRPIVTQIQPLANNFYPAEESHRRYYEKNSNQPYCQLVISPKLDKLREKFDALLKKGEN